MKYLFTRIGWILSVLCNIAKATDLDLLVVTVATDETDGFKRFQASTKYFNLDLLVLGMDEPWRGGDMQHSVGGGQKVNILRRNLEKYQDRKDLVIFFTDSYDVIFATGKDEILTKFLDTGANVVVSSEPSLWPDKSLKDQYPTVEVGNRYLCSGGIIGYAPTFWSLINVKEIEDKDDDQLYYTQIYINESLRTSLNMKLDHTSQIVQNLNHAINEIAITEVDDVSRVKNTEYMTFPCVIHGNGPSKIDLNRIGNYVPNGWHSEHGCRLCDTIALDDDKLPTVQIAMFVEQPTPFLEEFFRRIEALDYPKKNIHIFIFNQVDSAESAVYRFLSRARTSYASVHEIDPHDDVHVAAARNSAVAGCLQDGVDFQLSVDAHVQLTNAHTLKLLISNDKQIIAPFVKREGKLWSNFWGALNHDGFYERSDDYLPIANGQYKGIWNVPFITAVYLTRAATLRELFNLYGADDGIYAGLHYDPDMTMCAKFRDQGIFMYVTNEENYGRLLLTDDTRTEGVHQDLWQIYNNPVDWEEKYISPDFWSVTSPDTEVSQPCPDVYMFPLFTPEAADALVEVMETNGGWSDGRHKDERIAGGYENVPTVDIHMKQVGYEKEWLHLLSTYPRRIVEKVYPGFSTKAESIMMFVVRYRPSEQSFLRPHHDASTWTMNVALNSHGQDYEGGGCRFLRYNCSVLRIPKGYALIHPGRLTHYHEGLETTGGTRYISVSFVDP